jgi:hypothetical protein
MRFRGTPNGPHRDRAAATALAVPSPLVLGHGVAGAHNDMVIVGLVAVVGGV